MRQMAAAGRFYPGSEPELRETLEEFFVGAETEEAARNVLSPHAGYPFSGACAAYSYLALKPAETYVVLGPCHFVSVRRPAVSTQDWKTPLGRVEVDNEFIDELSGVQTSEAPHQKDHAVEVQLPFLQHQFTDFKIVPVAIGQADVSRSLELAKNIDRAAEATGREVAVVASSDLTHYEMVPQINEEDEKICDRILSLDFEGFFDLAARRGSVCGYGPILVAMSSGGITSASLLDYRNSAEVAGESKPAVGYASIAFKNS